MEKWIELLTPIIIAIITIIPTIIANRRKTQQSLKETTAAIKAEVATAKNEVAAVKQCFDSHVEEFEEAKAKAARFRILRFYDELCEGKKHSESHFEDILDDIDYYEHYCDTHPEFHNNRGHAAMEYVKEMYKTIKVKGGFLTHVKGEQDETSRQSV